MQLYAWSGDRAGALHQYRQCVQVLDQELGVAPLAETAHLYQVIKENQLPPPMPIRPAPSVSTKETASDSSLSGSPPALSLAPTAPSPVSSANVPLVGRSAEWAKLSEAYADSSTHSSIIILSGEAGIGKTRLAEELVAYARSKGASVVAARCYEGETQLAYEPFVEGVRPMLAQKQDVHWLENVPEPWLSEASRLVPELTLLHPGLPSPPQLDSPGAQTRFFEGLQQVLLAACGSGRSQYPGIIFIDDIHWADEATLALLSYMARRLRDHPVCLLLTTRNKQVHSDAGLKQLLVEAQRFSKARVLSLSRLNQATVKELVQSVLTTNPAPRDGLIERLYQETEGLPFFLIEYLTAITKGVLKAEDTNWSLPGGMRDLLHSHLASVSEIGWQILTTAAVIGRSFDFDTLSQASGRSEEETVTALEELIAQGIVEEVREGTAERGLNYDFSHEKLRTLVYEEASLARRRLLHRRIAEMLVGRMRGHRETNLLAGQIAHHYRMAGNDPAAAQYYALAGEHARSLYANREALAYFQSALALGHPTTALLHESIGDMYTLLGEYSAALKSYETAAALCDPHALATIEHKLGKVYERRGEWEAAEAHFESALHALGEAGPTGERAKIYADWSLAAHHRGQVDKALTLAHEALQLAEEAQDRRALAQVHNILGILASSQNNLEEALHHLESSLALAESLNDASSCAAALNNLALTYGARGEIERAITFAEAALALCTSQGDRHREAVLHSNLADLLHNVGRAEDALSHLKQSVSIYAEIGVEAGAYQPEIWKLVEW
jgi:predicted ATPase